MTQTAKYANVSAKIGAQRSNLLSEAKLRALSESKDLNDFVAQLKETAYQSQLANADPPYSGRKLERTFQENLAETCIKVVKNSPKAASVYLSIFLRKAETENIKALVKAVNGGLSAEQREAQVYLIIEDFFKRRPAFEEALKSQDLTQLSSAFAKTEYALAMNYGLQSYEEGGSTTCFDVLVDKTYYERLFDTYTNLPTREKPHALFYASMESTSYVLLMLLRGKNLNHDVNWLRVAVPDAHFLSNDTVESMVTATDFEAAFNIVQKSPYKDFFEKGEKPEEIIMSAEKAFKKAIYVHAAKSRISETFNIGVPLSFVYQKQAEASNLLTISLGLESGLKAEEIQSLLLLGR